MLAISSGPTPVTGYDTAPRASRADPDPMDAGRRGRLEHRWTPVRDGPARPAITRGAAMIRTPGAPVSPADHTARRFAESAAVTDGPVSSLAGLDAWYATRREAQRWSVEAVPLDGIRGWQSLPGGDLAHESGRFFTVTGLRVRRDGAVGWSQPIISQPEIGVLGIVVREIDGVLHCLMQAKMEPGNVNGVQLSPTVQATRSNYTGVHRGRAIPYLDVVRSGGASRVLADSLQSEQGAWFLGKRNRNIVVEAPGAVEVSDDFRWVTVGQLMHLLRRDNVVNMDARTVLACTPLGPPADCDGDDFTAALRRSMHGGYGARHSLPQTLSWLTEQRFHCDLARERIPLGDVERWRRTPDAISRDDGRFFRIIGVDVVAGSREVSSWGQPLLHPAGQGLAGLLVRRIDGVLHLLMSARAEAGGGMVIELAPTVQCCPDNYRDELPERRPAFLDMLPAPGDHRIRYDVVQSEEGGRFHHAETRNLIVEVGEEFPLDAPPGFRWLTVHQLGELLRHSSYVTVEARSVYGGLRTLAGW
jgi:oxidase EvaA